MEHADTIFALESWSPDLLAALLDLLGIDAPEQRARDAFAAVPSQVNSSRERGDLPSRLSWRDIPSSEAKTLAGRAAERWGYDLLDEAHAPAQP